MSEQEKKSPLDFLTRKVLDAAVKKDIGSQWNLTEHEIKEFIAKGDNHCCKVTSVFCKAISNGEMKTMSYVAKLNPLNDQNLFVAFLDSLFNSEIGFFCDAGVKLNEILEGISQPSINFPECFFSRNDPGSQILITKDLRQKNYEMYNRKIKMDYVHATLVIKELAKIHAASMILKADLKDKTMVELYPFLADAWLIPNTESRLLFGQMLTKHMDTTLKLLSFAKGYDNHRKWVENLKENVKDVYFDDITSGSEDMKVICHGDCWANNLLFRYDENRKPTGIYFVDFQFSRYGSLALDLACFFFTSLTGEARNAYQDQLLSEYYEEFKKIMKAADKPMKFSEEDLREEFKTKARYGILTGLLLLPLVLCEGIKMPDVNLVSTSDMEAFQEGFKQLLIQTADKNPIVMSQFLSLFDDAAKLGFVHV